MTAIRQVGDAESSAAASLTEIFKDDPSVPAYASAVGIQYNAAISLVSGAIPTKMLLVFDAAVMRPLEEWIAHLAAVKERMRQFDQVLMKFEHYTSKVDKLRAERDDRIKKGRAETTRQSEQVARNIAKLESARVEYQVRVVFAPVFGPRVSCDVRSVSLTVPLRSFLILQAGVDMVTREVTSVLASRFETLSSLFTRMLQFQITRADETHTVMSGLQTALRTMQTQQSQQPPQGGSDRFDDGTGVSLAPPLDSDFFPSAREAGGVAFAGSAFPHSFPVARSEHPVERVDPSVPELLVAQPSAAPVPPPRPPRAPAVAAKPYNPFESDGDDLFGGETPSAEGGASAPGPGFPSMPPEHSAFATGGVFSAHVAGSLTRAPSAELFTSAVSSSPYNFGAMSSSAPVAASTGDQEDSVTAGWSPSPMPFDPAASASALWGGAAPVPSAHRAAGVGGVIVAPGGTKRDRRPPPARKGLGL